MSTPREKIEQSIAALEAQRPALGDQVVELAISALRKQLDELGDAQLALDEQRKQVTVLFAEARGGPLSDTSLDIEDLTERINTLWARLDLVIQEHGGRIDKHMGDVVMAVWGVERSSEDDPERAVRAALEMQTVLADFQQGSAALLNLRQGLNTGPVVLSRVGATAEYTAIGDTVNVASRLQAAAEAGAILISQDTYRQVRGLFEVRALEPLTVKGKRDPLQVYQVYSARPRAFRRGGRGVEGIETRMVGRDAELAALQAAYRQVRSGGACQIATIVGDVGVGKSRLLYEFDAWVEVYGGRHALLRGRANQEFQSLPFALLRDLFMFRFELQDSDPLPVIWEKFERGVQEVLGYQESSRRRAHLIGQLLGFDFSASPHVRNVLADWEQLRDRALGYIDDFIHTLAGGLPVLVLLEDIHWADESSLEAIQHFAHALADRPVLLVCAARSGLFERRPQWLSGQARSLRLDLTPLTWEDSLALVDDILQKAQPAPELLREIVARSADGNPFYLEELIKMLIDDGVIITGPERWTVEAQRLGSVRVPPTLTGILQARFDSLPPRERSLLQHASVIGRAFWEDALAYVNQADPDGGWPAEALQPLLEAVLQREMVFRRDASLFADTDEYIFKHALLRDTIYESVLRRDRRVFHARVAEWLIAKAGSRSTDVAGLIAEHLERAGQDEQAAAYLTQAGEAALRVSAYREALSFCERALALLPAESRLAVAPNLRAGEALLGLSEYSRSRQRLEAGLELARCFDDEPSAASALNNLGWIDRNQGLYEAAQCHLNECLELTRKSGDQLNTARALSNLGWVDLKQGEYERARQRLTESQELFRDLEGPYSLAMTLVGLGVVARAARDYEAADKYMTEAVAIYREIGNRGGMASSFTGLGETARLQGQYYSARSYYKASLELDREIGDMLGVAIDLGNLGHASVALGDDPDAIGYYLEGLRTVLPIGSLPFALDILAGLAGALARTGQPQLALQIIAFAEDNPALMDETRPILDASRLTLQQRLGSGAYLAARRAFQSQNLEALAALLPL